MKSRNVALNKHYQQNKSKFMCFFMVKFRMSSQYGFREYKCGYMVDPRGEVTIENLRTRF